jgi:hypothetical protein
MTTEIIERNILVRDTDGDWYSISPSLEKEFLALKEEMIEMDSCSDEYMDAQFKLSETFSQYLKD